MAEPNADVPRISVNQPPGGGSIYPFTVTTSLLVGAVLDFYLSYDDMAGVLVLPFTLTLSDTLFTVTDSNNVVVAAGDVTEAKSQAWGARIVYGWTFALVVMRVVVRPDRLVDATAPLDPRTCNKLPGRLRSLRVGDVVLTGVVNIIAGNNISLSGALPTASTDGGRFVSQINMDAVPGAGLGQVDGCVDVVPAVRQINGVQPDCAGNFVIEMDDCYRAQLPVAVAGGINGPRTATYAATGYTDEQAATAVRLTNDCMPCRPCSAYVDVYRGLKRQWAIWTALAQQAEAVNATYNANRARWLTQLACRADNPGQLVVTAETNCKTYVGGSFCNVTTCCVLQVELRFTLFLYTNGALQAGYAPTITDATLNGEAYSPEIVGNVVRFFVDSVSPQNTVTAQLAVRLTGCSNGQALQATFTVHAPDPGVDSRTGLPCTLPDLTAPANVLGDWTALNVPADPTTRVVLTQTAPFNSTLPAYPCQ